MDIFGIPSQTWFPVVTLIIGSLLKAAFDWVSDRRVTQRERDARRDQRNDALRLRRIEFQRATLLELQDAVIELARFAAQIQHHDFMASQASGVWAKQSLPAEIDEGFRTAQASVNRYHVRSRDQQVRDLSARLSSTCTDVGLARTQAISDRASQDMVDINRKLNERIGIVLRTLEDDEDKVIED